MGSEVGLINLSLKETLNMDYGTVDNVIWNMNDTMVCVCCCLSLYVGNVLNR